MHGSGVRQSLNRISTQNLGHLRLGLSPLLNCSFLFSGCDGPELCLVVKQAKNINTGAFL